MAHPDSWEDWCDWPAPKPPTREQKPQPLKIPLQPQVARGMCVTVVNHNGEVLVSHGGKFPVAGFHTQTDPDHTNDEMARRCVKNMIGVEIGPGDVFSVGPHYLVWLEHTNEHVTDYTTVKKYQNKVGNLRYVKLGDVDQYARDNGTRVLPAFKKVLSALESHISRIKMMA